MIRRLAELDRLDLQHRSSGGDRWAVAPTPTAPGQGSARVSVAGHRSRPLATTVKVLAVLGIVATATAALVRAEYGVTIGLDGVHGPERLLDPVAAAGPGGSHAFMMEERGRPVTYNPCKPIDIVVNDALAPPRADRLVDEAVASVERATGLRIRVTGTTDEPPSEHRPNRQRDRYGDRWAPVLLAWTSPEQEARLEGDIAGIGGSVPVSSGMSGDLRYVTGIVFLDAPQFRRLLPQVAGWERARAIVMHELGHLVGLAHVEDPMELMGEQNMIPMDFGPGDLEGLAKLGNGSCL
jgi:hypothetical protein